MGPPVVDPPFFVSDPRRFRAGRRVELRHRGRDVVAHRAGREVYALRRSPRAGAVAHVAEDLQLTVGQRARALRQGGRGDLGVDVAPAGVDVAHDPARAGPPASSLGTNALAPAARARRRTPGRAWRVSRTTGACARRGSARRRRRRPARASPGRARRGPARARRPARPRRARRRPGRRPGSRARARAGCERLAHEVLVVGQQRAGSCGGQPWPSCGAGRARTRRRPLAASTRPPTAAKRSRRPATPLRRCRARPGARRRCPHAHDGVVALALHGDLAALGAGVAQQVRRALAHERAEQRLQRARHRLRRDRDRRVTPAARRIPRVRELGGEPDAAVALDELARLGSASSASACASLGVPAGARRRRRRSAAPRAAP